MESSQFINQMRLSKKQLQLHVQQQNQKYYIDSPQDNYPQSQCQYFTSVTTPTLHEYPAANQHQPSQCLYEQSSPSHRRPNKKKFHKSDPNSIEVCINYENNHNEMRGAESSVGEIPCGFFIPIQTHSSFTSNDK